MTNPTLQDATVVAELNDLLQLDHDAVGAYTLAIDELDDPTLKATLTGYRGDHERHITELTAVRLERGSRSELRALLALAPGLSREQMMDAVTRAQEALSADPVLTDRVDSLELYPMAVAGE